jgi:hypothetical protein
MKLLPTVQVGTSRLVERDALATFLEGVQKADDTASFMVTARKEKPRVSQKRLRSLVRRDLEPVSLGKLPANIRLGPGQLEVSFDSVERLAEAMYFLARVLELEGDEFARRYEPASLPVQNDDVNELRALFAELGRIEEPRS